MHSAKKKWLRISLWFNEFHYGLWLALIHLDPESSNKRFSLQFRYSNRFDVVLMMIGTFGALAQGVLLPVQFIIFGSLSDSFIEYTVCQNPLSNCTETVNIEEEMKPFAYYYIGIAVAMAVAVAIRMVSWGLTAERQTHKIRQAFFRSILRQEMGWFDTNDAGELNTRLSEYGNYVYLDC